MRDVASFVRDFSGLLRALSSRPSFWHAFLIHVFRVSVSSSQHYHPLLPFIMSQDLYKRKGLSRRNNHRDESHNKAKDARFQFIVDNFRKIEINPDDDSSNGFEDFGTCQLQPQNINNTPICSVSSEDDDWDNPTPRVDMRTFNYDLPGILCPFCRENLMKQNVMDGQLKCNCGGSLECKIPIMLIKDKIRETVVFHSNACPSNRSPEYTMFKSHIVLTCHVCKLVEVVSS